MKIARVAVKLFKIEMLAAMGPAGVIILAITAAIAIGYFCGRTGTP